MALEQGNAQVKMLTRDTQVPLAFEVLVTGCRGPFYLLEAHSEPTTWSTSQAGSGVGPDCKREGCQEWQDKAPRPPVQPALALPRADVLTLGTCLVLCQVLPFYLHEFHNHAGKEQSQCLA